MQGHSWKSIVCGRISDVSRGLLAFAAIIATLLCQAPSAAQSPAGPALAKPSTVSGSGASPLGQRPRAVAAGGVQSGNPAAKPNGGPNEGIKVHGHWVIEVRNPDGSLAAHREFENSLATTAGDNGGGVLAALLGGAITPGSWSVVLSPLGGQPRFVVTPANSTASTWCSSASAMATEGQITCFTGLAVTPPVVSASQGTITGSTLTLAGTFIVPNVFPISGVPSQVGYVETDTFLCAPTDTSAQCFNGGYLGYFMFTSRNLDGMGTDPIPVPVNIGQSVNVTVTISFQ